MLENDVLTAANLMIDQHGYRAELLAAQNAQLMLEHGDQGSAGAWEKIIIAIGGLRREAGDPVGSKH
jgi:hypothetical protein